METEDLDIEFPSFRSVSSSSVIQKDSRTEEPIIPLVKENKTTMSHKDIAYKKFNEINLLFSKYLGWTSLRDGNTKAIAPMGYGAPYTNTFSSSIRGQQIELPIYTKNIASIWDSIFYVSKNNPGNFEFEILSNWNSVKNENNSEEEFSFITADINIYFNKMRKFIYDVPLAQTPLAFCLIFINLNGEKTSEFESFFNLKVQSIDLDK